MARNYTTSLEGMIELIGHEGICLNLYLDSVGVRTIGAGATVSEIPNIKSLPWTYSITMGQAIELFKKSLRKYENGVNKALNVDITQQQFDALVSFAYNVGYAGAAGSTAMKRINRGESKEKVAQALMLWNKPKEIIGRRNKERLLFETGKYQNNGKALLFPVNPSNHKPIYSKGKQIDVRDYLTQSKIPIVENKNLEDKFDKQAEDVLLYKQDSKYGWNILWNAFKYMLGKK